jgi:AcrR family transcriptional regulator
MTRSQMAQDKVRAAAIELLHEVGVQGFTVDAVTRRSGVAKTTIYRHWPNVAALLTDAVACQIRPLPTPNTGSLRGDLQAFFGSVMPPENLDELSRLISGLLHAASTDTDLRAALDELIRERRAPLRTIVELAQGRGEVPPWVNIDDAVDLIEGPFVYGFLVRRRTFAPADAVAMLELSIAGLTATR